MPFRRVRLALTPIILLVAVAALAPAPSLELGPPERIADGVEFYRTSDERLLSPPGPVAVQMLRVDLRKADLKVVLALDQVLGTETVGEMAARHGAMAAVNAGFFLPTGEPAGLLKVGGELVSDASLQRGAVGIQRRRPSDRQRLVFDQVSGVLALDVSTGRARWRLPLDGVDTVRGDGQFVWFTPRFGAETRTNPGGVEWLLRGSPLSIVERHDLAGATPIPAGGAVLSGGPSAPTGPTGRLQPGATVRAVEIYRPRRSGRADDWVRATDIVGGAGLLVHSGRPLGEWAVERLRPGFSTERHPRTMIGLDGDDRVWLVTVDGRRPALSLGMSFAELQGLARALRLRHALNLDGGGSTTMVANGQTRNHPSDPTGPRRVSDALLVAPRARAGRQLLPRD